MDLFENRVSPGVDPAAEVKAGFLADDRQGQARRPADRQGDAPSRCSAPCSAATTSRRWSPRSQDEDARRRRRQGALRHHLRLRRLRRGRSSWPRPRTPPQGRFSSPGPTPSGSPRGRACPQTIKVKVFKVDGEINTDDFSPAGDASTRPDIPLHALAMGKTRFPGGLTTIAEYRAAGLPGGLRRRRGRHRLVAQVGLQQRPLAHRRGHPVRAQQAPRRRHHRRRHRPHLLQHRRGLRRAAASRPTSPGSRRAT